MPLIEAIQRLSKNKNKEMLGLNYLNWSKILPGLRLPIVATASIINASLMIALFSLM
jgi:hypothetical protein